MTCLSNRVRSDRTTGCYYNRSILARSQAPRRYSCTMVRVLDYRLPVAQPAACISEDIRVSVIVDNYPEIIVLGYLDGPLGVGLVIHAHVVLVNRVRTVGIEVDPDSIVTFSLHLNQQQLHVRNILSWKHG